MVYSQSRFIDLHGIDILFVFIFKRKYFVIFHNDSLVYVICDETTWVILLMRHFLFSIFISFSIQLTLFIFVISPRENYTIEILKLNWPHTTNCWTCWWRLKFNLNNNLSFELIVCTYIKVYFLFWQLSFENVGRVTICNNKGKWLFACLLTY